MVYCLNIVWFGVFSVGCGQDADLLRLHNVGVRLHQRWSRRLPRAQSTLARPGRRPVARTGIVSRDIGSSRNNKLTTKRPALLFLLVPTSIGGSLTFWCGSGSADLDL